MEEKETAAQEIADEKLAGASGGQGAPVPETGLVGEEDADEGNDQVIFCPRCGRPGPRCTCW